MSIAKRLILAGFMGAIVCSYPQKVWAKDFTNSVFLEMSPEHQKFWLSGAMDTLVYIAAFKSKDIGQCVSDWYFGEKIGERNWLILESMKKYPDHKPIAVLAALSQRSCGQYIEVG